MVPQEPPGGVGGPAVEGVRAFRKKVVVKAGGYSAGGDRKELMF